MDNINNMKNVISSGSNLKTPSGILNCQGMPTDHGIKELPDLVNQLQPIQRIFKVPNHVKQSNLEAYQPKLVSVGPYHFGELQLQPMETHKRRAQDIFVERSKLTMNHYKVEMKEILDTLKESYADLDHVLWSDDDKFINQIILDGCFLIAFFCEPLSFFKQHAIDYEVLMQDLVMVDNQLPYIALEKLLTTSGKNPDFIYKLMRPGLKESGFHILEMYMGRRVRYRELGERLSYKVVGNLSASELCLFNVQFTKAKSLSKMKFNSNTGVFKLPAFIINEHTTCFYLNMVAHALTQTSPIYNVFPIHARLMGTLVRSTKDILLLQSRGIIINELSGHDAAVDVIQEIARGSITLENVVDDKGLSFNLVQDRLNKFCQNKNYKTNNTWRPWKLDFGETHLKTQRTALFLLVAIILLAVSYIVRV